MTQITYSLQKLDPATKRRLALAKVYRLLIRLAEESQDDTSTLEITDTPGEKIGEHASLGVDPSN